MTQTLHWSTEVEFVDVWTGAFLVLMRLLLVALLLMPLGLVFRSAVRRAVRARQGRPQVEVASEFARIVDEILTLLDEAEQMAVQSEAKAGRAGSSDPYAWLFQATKKPPQLDEAGLADSNSLGLLGKYYAKLSQATRKTSELEDVIERLVALLGEGKTVDAARAVAAALESRSQTIHDAQSDLFHAPSAPYAGGWPGADTNRFELVRMSLNESRLAALAKRDGYVNIASREIKAAVPRVSG